MLFRLTRDDISPALTRLMGLAKRPKPVIRAAGMVFKSITEGNFNAAGAAFRPMPWKAKMDGTPSNLQDSTTLARSFHIEVTENSATVSNPMPYAAIHQFGGTIEAKNAKALMWTVAGGKKFFAKRVRMPARPFFPVLNGRMTAAAERLVLAAAQRELDRQAGR